MKTELLQNAIIGIDDDLIVGADFNKDTVKQKSFKKCLLPVAACFALVVIGVGILNIVSKNSSDTDADRTLIDKHFQATEELEFETPASPDMCDWDKMIDTERFPELTFNGSKFTTNLIAVHAENEGDLLGTTTMAGEYIKEGTATGEIKTVDVKIYAIRGISPDVAVAVRFSDDDKYSYAYSDSWYKPTNLDDFVTKLNLMEYMQTGLCYYYNGNASDVEVYEDITTADVWTILLDDLTALNEPDSSKGREVMSISTSVDVLGNHKKSIMLTEDGYLLTNLLETEKCFFVGKEKVDAFINYVINNHQGYHYIYDLTDDTGLLLE